MHKSLTPSRVTVKNADAGEVEAVFATLNVIDKDGDVILPGAIRDGAPIVVSAYGHKSWEGLLPVGKGSIHEVGDELVARMSFFLETSHGKDTFGTVKGLGEQGEWSWSLQEITSTQGEWEGEPANIIAKVGHVREVSPVLAGASVGTRTLAVKAEGLKFSEHLDAVVAAVRELADRAEEVVALRAAKGKTIGDDAAQSLTELGEELDRVKSLTAPPDPPIQDTSSDDAARILLARIARDQGVTIS